MPAVAPADKSRADLAVHAGIPDGVDPVAIEAMDDRLARLIQIAANIADDGPPLPGNPEL